MRDSKTFTKLFRRLLPNAKKIQNESATFVAPSNRRNGNQLNKNLIRANWFTKLALARAVCSINYNALLHVNESFCWHVLIIRYIQCGEVSCE